MKLLVVTQVVDENDRFLGFFHRWLSEMARTFEQVEVICLYEGTHSLPGNVHIYSLGKEEGRRGKMAYARSFYKRAWKARRDYDAVFVHMNEEYVLLGGLLWRLLGKPVYLWRNHYAGTHKTHIAAFLSKKVFYTSNHSYTARFKNAVRMPVGVDTTRFESVADSARAQNSILFLARMSPSKRPELLLEALVILKQRGVSFTASFVGNPLKEDRTYYEGLQHFVQEKELGSYVQFAEGMPHKDTPEVFGAHHIFVNCSPSGMLDKTLFEAAVSGCAVFASSEDWQEIVHPAEPYFADADSLADLLEQACTGDSEDLISAGKLLSQTHGLSYLIERIYEECVRK